MALDRGRFKSVKADSLISAEEMSRRAFDELPSDPQVLEAARRVHPSWIAAHGNRNDIGIEGLAREIGQCAAALVGSANWNQARGNGIIVLRDRFAPNLLVIGIDAAQFSLDRCREPIGMMSPE